MSPFKDVFPSTTPLLLIHGEDKDLTKARISTVKDLAEEGTAAIAQLNQESRTKEINVVRRISRLGNVGS